MYLRQLFRILFRTLNYNYDYVFDWTMLKQRAAVAAASSTVTSGRPGYSTAAAAGQPMYDKTWFCTPFFCMVIVHSCADDICLSILLADESSLSVSFLNEHFFNMTGVDRKLHIAVDWECDFFLHFVTRFKFYTDIWLLEVSFQRTVGRDDHSCLYKTHHLVRDVLDIQFQLARYLAVFYCSFPVPAKMLNGTGYCNWIFYLTNIDVGKFTYLLARKPCYSLQSAIKKTKQCKSNY